MNQAAFATVILRLIGFYIVYDLLAGLAMGLIIQQVLFMPSDLESERWVFFGWLGISLMTRIGVGVILILFAERISRILFREEQKVITDGMINGAALFWVGLSLLGFYFLIAYLPSLIEIGFQWFKAEATDSDRLLGTRVHGTYYSPIEPIVMSILSLFLIFKSRTICSWGDRVAR